MGALGTSALRPRDTLPQRVLVDTGRGLLGVSEAAIGPPFFMAFRVI